MLLSDSFHLKIGITFHLAFFWGCSNHRNTNNLHHNNTCAEIYFLPYKILPMLEHKEQIGEKPQLIEVPQILASS
jgi:hypothetical protein